MNKKSFYALTLLLFAGIAGLIVYKYSKDRQHKAAAVYTLQQRRGPAANSAEWASARTTATTLQEALKKNPADNESALALASLFIREARVTGNYVYYDRAAMKYVNNVLERDSANFNALLFKSLIFLSQHHFAEGLETAGKAQQLNPYNAFVYGILVDGYVEMGNYQAAVENSDRMVSIRPDIRSYSRISYLREIHGDLPGAIDAMKMAVEAGPPGDESTEWSRVQLGRLYENTGELKYAAMHYTIALNQRPGYAYALAGLARLAVAEKKYQRAIGLYLQADSMVTDYAFREELAEVYALAGDKEKAKAATLAVIEGLSRDAQQGAGDDNIGHYADRELAYAYLKVNDYEKAITHALLEYGRRPDNIDVNETVAWVYYRKGDYAKALPYMKAALKTGCKNPELLCRAGLLYAKTGEPATAKSLLQQALKNHPNLPSTLKEETATVLATL